jgi:hypothetical protein
MTWYDNLILIGIGIIFILVFAVLFKMFYLPLYNQTTYTSDISTKVSQAAPVFQETQIQPNISTQVPEPAVGPTVTDLNAWFDEYNATYINGEPYQGPNAYEPTNFTVNLSNGTKRGIILNNS